MDPYTVTEHKHRFAAWAAARAPRGIEGLSGTLCNALFTASPLRAVIDSPDQLPAPHDLDASHRQWREQLIAGARGHSVLTHGIAAKLINVYLKVLFTCGPDLDHPNVRMLHPPFDRGLLQSLEMDAKGNRDRWGKYRRIGWQNWDCDIYEGVVASARAELKPGEPFWMIERHWPGYVT